MGFYSQRALIPVLGGYLFFLLKSLLDMFEFLQMVTIVSDNRAIHECIFTSIQTPLGNLTPIWLSPNIKTCYSVLSAVASLRKVPQQKEMSICSVKLC